MDSPNTAITIDPSSIKGWAVDADPANDPTYPYRDRLKDDGPPMDWDRPTAQEAHVELLQSVEHERRPAVFGSSTPPSGISGLLRRAAFRFTESNWAHWLLLLGADRINVVEGVVQDLAGGRVPNIPAEMGMRSKYAHNKRGLTTKLVAVGAISALVIGLAKSRHGRTRRDPGRLESE